MEADLSPHKIAIAGMPEMVGLYYSRFGRLPTHPSDFKELREVIPPRYYDAVQSCSFQITDFRSDSPPDYWFRRLFVVTVSRGDDRVRMLQSWEFGLIGKDWVPQAFFGRTPNDPANLASWVAIAAFHHAKTKSAVPTFDQLDFGSVHALSDLEPMLANCSPTVSTKDIDREKWIIVRSDKWETDFAFPLSGPRENDSLRKIPKIKAL